MCERVEGVVAAVQRIATGLETDTVPPERARELVETFSRLENIVAAARTLALKRVAETGAWRAEGANSAASWLAGVTGTSVRQAASFVDTAVRIASQPYVRDAMVAGDLSREQAVAISAAAGADPDAEAGLVAMAASESLPRLREACSAIAEAARPVVSETERRRRLRSCRHWTDQDQMIRVAARLTPEDGAGLVRALEARTQERWENALRSGEIETREACEADALCSLVGDAPKVVVSVHVSHGALARGHTEPGETCRVEGVGPISVAAAKRLAMGGSIRVLEVEGKDVRRVVNAGRMIPAVTRAALETRDPSCVVPGCGRRFDLEIDHIVPLADGGLTELSNLARLCRAHHAKKTFHGWRLSGRPGAWRWERADEGTRGAAATKIGTGMLAGADPG